MRQRVELEQGCEERRLLFHQRLDVCRELDRRARGGGGGCTDGAITTALAVTVATPAMRTERAEIFITALSSFGIPDLDETYARFAGCVS